MSNYKLTIELVPTTCWYSNVRTNVSKSEWNVLKKLTATKAGHRCEICQGRGPKWPVECHEVWNYSDGIQKLERLIALCPSCHEVKHIGFAGTRGRQDIATKHMMKVNQISKEEAAGYIKSAFDIWRDRSQQDWKLDITYLDMVKHVEENPWSV